MLRDKLATSVAPKFVSFSKDAGDIPFSSIEIFSSDSANPPPAVEAQNPDFLLGLEQVVALVDATGEIRSLINSRERNFSKVIIDF